APFVVIVDAEDRRGGVIARAVSAIEPEWLLEMYPDRIRDVAEASWNAAAERVDAVGRLLYDGLVLDESTGTTSDPAEVTRVLRAQALNRGPHAFADGDALDRLLGRTRFVATLSSGFPALGEVEAKEALSELCEGARSFDDLRRGSLIEHL